MALPRDRAMQFTKMHGCGNDYVVVEAIAGEPFQRFSDASEEQVASLARETTDRRHGVGADGFVLVLPESRAGSPAAFEMRMYNPDGSYSAMCGNALRCVAKRLIDSGDAPGDALSVRTGDSLVALRVVARDSAGAVAAVEADLGPPRFAPEAVPCLLPAGPEGDLRAATLETASGPVAVTVLSTGNPHCVVFVDEPPSDSLVATVGPAIERHAAFPERTNVEFVEVLGPRRLRQRTWERGAGETLACGSGACAVAVAAALTGRCERAVSVELLGGELRLEWRASDGHVLMTGPAVEVFAGRWPR